MSNISIAAGSSKPQSSTSRFTTVHEPDNSNNRSLPPQPPAIDTAVPSTYTRIHGINAYKQQNSQSRQTSSTSSHPSLTDAQPSTNASVTTRVSSYSEQNNNYNMPDSHRPLSPNIFGEQLQSRVLALHDFTPLAPNATCLSFQAGQVILVHNRDPSGWWDGELELEGRRGWFPSNYVSGLDQIGRLRDEVLVELRKSRSNHDSISSLASWTSAVSPRSVSPTLPQSQRIPNIAGTDQLLTEPPPEFSSPDPAEISISDSPTIVRKVARSNQPETIDSIQSINRPDSSIRALSPTFSLYNAIASGAISTRSISPPHSLSSSHQPLLNPLRHAISLLNRAVAGRRQAHYQPSTACVISCIRSLLMSTECLHRDAPVLKRIPALAKERKIILGNLATLVAQARRCSEWPGEDDMAAEDWQGPVHQAEVEQQDWELEQMLKMGSEVLRSVSQFLEECEAHGIELPVARRSTKGSTGTSQTGSSGSEQDMNLRLRMDLGVATPMTTPHRRTASGLTTPPIPRGPTLSTLRTKSLNDLRARRRMQHLERSKQVPTVPVTGTVSTTSTSISSASSFSSASGNSAVPSSVPSGPCSLAQVLSALRHCNDALLSAIAAFIGHVHSYGRHSHASSKGHLIELARETVDMVRQLLTIVDAVARHPDVVGRSKGCQATKASLFDATNELVESVRAMTATGSITSPSDNEEEERGRTLHGATSVLKVAGDCVAAVKVCISRPIGDAPFVICLPSLSAAPETTRARVSYLRRRSISVAGISTVKIVQEPRDIGNETDLTLEAVEVPEETEAELKAELVKDRSSAASQSDEDERDSARSRRSSIAQTTPATSVIPDDKDACSPLEEKLLHGDLPTPSDSFSVPPTPSSPTHSIPLLDDNVFTSFLSHDYGVHDIAYNNEGAIVGATLEAMIEKMTPHDALVEPAFHQIFMMTWRLFMSPPDFVNALVNRYNIRALSSLNEADLLLWTNRKSKPVKLRVANLIKTWLENYWRTDTDKGVLPQLGDFVRGTIGPQFPGPAKRILDIIRARMSADDSPVSARPIDRTKSVDRFRETPMTPQAPVSPSDIPRPAITKALFSALKNKTYSSVVVTDFDVLELARQFTIMESKLYLKVRPEELLELGQPGGASAVNVKSISSLSTAITGWVTECILNESDAKKRTTLMKFFIKVADRCSGLNNFSTSRSILAALDSSTISRLHQTWTSLSQKSKARLESLRKMADHARNYSEYRSRLRSTNPPAVPFLGLYLTDITFCREGNPDYRAPSGNRPLINFNKYHKLARIVQDMQRFQFQYNLKEIPEVQQYLMAQFEQAKNAGDLHDLYRRSLLVEPRRPADASISSSDGKQPLLQIWGLGTLSRAQGAMLASKNAS